MPYLIHFIERIVGEDHWYHREDTTTATPGEWLLARRLDEIGRLASAKSVVSTDILLVSATQISQGEADELKAVSLDLVFEREKPKR